jgi:hypothetical protein
MRQASGVRIYETGSNVPLLVPYGHISPERGGSSAAHRVDMHGFAMHGVRVGSLETFADLRGNPNRAQIIGCNEADATGIAKQRGNISYGRAFLQSFGKPTRSEASTPTQTWMYCRP